MTRIVSFLWHGLVIGHLAADDDGSVRKAQYQVSFRADDWFTELLRKAHYHVDRWIVSKVTFYLTIY